MTKQNPKTRESFLQVFRDPLSGYRFFLYYPFKLKTRWAIHPAYNEDFSTSYKNAKEVLLTHEHLYNIQTKKLVFGIMLYHLSQTGVFEFKQFSQLKVSYTFFNDHQFLAKFFFILPIMVRMPKDTRKRYPRFRLTADHLDGLKFWVEHCVHRYGHVQVEQAHNSYDEKYVQMNALYTRWKLETKSLHKFPKKLTRYIFQCAQTPPSLIEKWDIFFEKSAGELWINHKSKSLESVDLFWNLLDCIDQIELSDYQNPLTRFTSQWLKHKANEWAAWEPSYDDLLLDHKLSYKKKVAISNIYKTWEQESEQKSLDRLAMNESKKTIEDRIKKLRAERQQKNSNSLFSIIELEEKKDD